MKSTLVTPAMFLAFQLTLPTSLLTAAPQNANATKSTNKNAANAHSHTAEELSRQATRLLQEVDKARQAVAAKQTQTAVTDIDLALRDRNQLAAVSKSQGQSMIVPLYSELDDTSVLGPVLAARKGKPQPSTSRPITVDEASAQYTFVGLDLDKAKSRLDAAKTALHNHNPQAASDSLAAIGSDLVVSTQESDLPLLAARENLGIARIAIKNRKYPEATAALKEASSDVDKYSKEDSAHHAQEARDLHQKIDSLSQNIAHNHSDATSKIDQWWHEVDSWFTNEIHT